ncbi:MAG: ATP-binding cassette domain-containing protein [Clostridiales bacterium]|nr:ATP-binding cassette domain-containing protein [Clostridiales bacterium]
MIELKNISKSYGSEKVISDFSVQFEEGISYCIMGSSGIGKTTLLNIMSGILKPDSGSITGLKDKKKSFIFQENRLIPWLTAYENITYVTNDGAEAEKSLKKAGIYSSKDKLPEQMSGGMQRRLAITRAAAASGDVFFIDEPLYGLDAKTEKEILIYLKEIISGKTSFTVTHSPEDAYFIADKILFLNNSPVSSCIIKDKSSFNSPEELKNVGII